MDCWLLAADRCEVCDDFCRESARTACSECNAAFHVDCLRGRDACPKCHAFFDVDSGAVTAEDVSAASASLGSAGSADVQRVEATGAITVESIVGRG